MTFIVSSLYCLQYHCTCTKIADAAANWSRCARSSGFLRTTGNAKHCMDYYAVYLGNPTLQKKRFRFINFENNYSFVENGKSCCVANLISFYMNQFLFPSDSFLCNFTTDSSNQFSFSLEVREFMILLCSSKQSTSNILPSE